MVTEAAHSPSLSLGPKCPTQLTLHSPRFHSNGMNGKKSDQRMKKTQLGSLTMLNTTALTQIG